MGRTSRSFETIAFWFTCLFAFLVHCQLTVDGERFSSDMRLHLGFILHPGEAEAAGYSLLHTICGILLKPFASMSERNLDAVASGVMTLVLAVAFYYSLTLVYDFWSKKYPANPAWKTGAASVSVFLISMAILMPLIQSLYVGVFTGNPWHNPTYLFSRVFALLAFLEFLRLMDAPSLEAGAQWSNLTLLGIASALSIWAKPSFMLALGPTFGVALLVAKIRQHLDWAQFGRMVIALLPSVVVLLVIRQRIYAEPGVANSVVFSPGLVWGQYTPSYLMSLALAATFPLYVAAVRWRQLTYGMRLALLNWTIATALFYFFAEQGPRATHANFAWCYMGGLFFLFWAAIEQWFMRGSISKRWLFWAGNLLFLIHLVSGIRYFLRILGGGSYM